MKFYQDADGVFHLGNSIVPKGQYAMEVFDNDTVISITSLDGKDLKYGPVEVTNVEKEDGSTYADLAELLSAVKDFFL